MKNQSTTPTTRHARRGSAILIVVGTLALIAVFAAIYIAIGQSDQRVARSIVNKQEIEEFRNNIAGHITGVIKDDRLDTMIQHRDNTTAIFTIRELTDAPYTDWTMRSASPNAWERFNPSGDHDLPSSNNASLDFRVASDPWLASTSPTFLGNPGQPRNGDDLRPFGSLITNFSLDPANYIGDVYSSGFLDLRDWKQISNLAPDGRFVNLFNLRPNQALSNGFNDITFGGFDSEAGDSTFDRPSDGRQVRRMSNYLSLWKPIRGDANNPDPLSELQAFDPEIEGIWFPGRNEPVPASNHGITGDLSNVPAVWTMYQRFMFQPINQPFLTFNRNQQVSTWADPDFSAYQYADADGDGMIDARWFELTSAQLFDVPTTDPRDDIERLYNAGQYRLFAAARVIDLSSLVNINTAMDQLAEPEPTAGSRGAPIGATPAEVDLRRLLSMTDPAHSYTILQLAGLSPSNFHKPVLTSNNDLADTDYKWYRSFRIPGGDRIEPSTNAFSVGRYAYDAIKRGIEFGDALDDRYYAWPPVVRETNNTLPAPTTIADFDDDFNAPDADYANTDYRLNQFFLEPDTVTPLDAEARVRWYEEIGRLDPFSSQEVADNQGYNAVGSPYKEDDLLELLTYHGLNDPSTLSRLEKSAMGRMPSIFGQNQRAFTPLLSNRPLSLDRERHGFIDQGNYAITAPGEPREITGQIAKESMSFFAVTPRRLITTASGSVPIAGGNVITQPAGLPLTTSDEVPTLEAAFQSPQALFSIYQRALAGELNPGKITGTINDLFVDDLGATDPRTLETASLFYGHRGPELALRIAAHMAVNAADMYDIDTTPTVATVLIDNSLRDEFGVTNFPAEDPDPANAFYRDYPGVADSNLFDAGESNLPGTQPGSNHITDEHRQAVNVYGIEPSPIITEVTSFYVYSDASDSAGGDDDYLTIKPRLGSGGIILPGLPQPETVKQITINNDTDPSNPDMMMQGIAFQLHNPFDVEISLGGDDLGLGQALTRQLDPTDSTRIDTSANYQFDYYIEWHGYFFKLAEYIQYYPPSTAIENTEFRESDIDQSLLGVNAPHIDFQGSGPLDSGNGNYLDPIDYPDYVARNIIMQPGETRVFYALADPSFNIAGSESTVDTKWRNAMVAYNELSGQYSTDVDGDGLGEGLDDRGWTGPAQDFIGRQFLNENFVGSNVGTRAVVMHPMDPRTGEYLPVAFFDYLQVPGSELGSATNRQDIGEARLWRKILTPSEETTDATISPSTTENLLHNDLLIDRIRVASVAQPLTENGEVPETVGFPEDYPTTGAEIAANVRNDNSGYTVVKWATSSRRDSVDLIEPGKAQVRKWMLSSRLDPDSTIVSAADTVEDFDGDDSGLSNQDLIDATDLDDPREPMGDIAAGEATFRTNYEIHHSLRSLWSQLDRVFVTTGLDPWLKSDLDSIALNQNGPDGSMTVFGRDADGQLSNPVDSNITLHETGDTDPTNQRPDLFVTAQRFNDAPRLGDLLLAWGIGPTFAPTASGSLSNNDLDPGYYPEEWMTMTEALAIALGYELPVASDESADNIWADTFNVDEQTLDNGRLSLDNYVPYYNIDTTEDPPEFTVTNTPANNDIRRGSGIPMALTIMDQARPIVTLDSTADQLTTPTYGQININTAPVEVLRLLPGLSPSVADYYPDATPTTSPEWWANSMTSLDLPDLSAPEETPDIAATMVGYRDRTFVQPRAQSADPTVQDTNPVNYSPSDPDANNSIDNTDRHAFNLVNELPIDLSTSDEDHRDRQTISGIDGLRPTPGFASVGEILAVTFGPDALGAGNGGSAGFSLRDFQSQLSIQQFGTDTDNLDGMDPTEIAIDPQIFGGDQTGETIDDYAERLAIANGILNTISVRSDYFAVWFVIHAYQPSDVENLQPEDPLVPSIAKRYVMVIDRTNVKTPGDTPKVVFLKEVPM